MRHTVLFLHIYSFIPPLWYLCKSISECVVLKLLEDISLSFIWFLRVPTFLGLHLLIAVRTAFHVWSCCWLTERLCVFSPSRLTLNICRTHLDLWPSHATYPSQPCLAVSDHGHSRGDEAGWGCHGSAGANGNIGIQSREWWRTTRGPGA